MRRKNHLQRAVIRTLIVASIILYIDFIFGLHGLLAVSVLTGALINQFVKREELHTWSKKNFVPDKAPHAEGPWGELYDRTLKYVKRQRHKQRNLKKTINKIQLSTSALREGVIMTNGDGLIEWWNKSAEHLIDFRLSTDRGQNILNLIRSPSFKLYFDSQNYNKPFMIDSPIAQGVWLEFIVTVYGNNSKMIVVRDISHIARLEEMRRDFVANVSHELRTPLTVIHGYVETFLTYGQDLAAPWKKGLTQMHQQSQRMELLISDLLILSNLETTDSHHHYTDIDIEAMLKSILNDANELSGKRGHHITLTLKSHNHLQGRHDEIRSAFSNVIFNAIKYTPDKGDIDICWFTNELGAYLRVKDNGQGIATKHIPRLTERFYRTDESRNSETGGTGLGLAIVKHVLIHHEGYLDIKSTLGQGSEFTCCLPYSRVIQKDHEEEELKTLQP